MNHRFLLPHSIQVLLPFPVLFKIYRSFFYLSWFSTSLLFKFVPIEIEKLGGFCIDYDIFCLPGLLEELMGLCYDFSLGKFADLC